MFHPFLRTHKTIYCLCTFPHIVCCARNIVILFLCLEKSYLTFLFCLNWFLPSTILFDGKKLPISHACILTYIGELWIHNGSSLYIPLDKCMVLNKWNVWLYFRFHSHGHWNQSNQCSPRWWTELIFVNRIAGGLIYPNSEEKETFVTFTQTLIDGKKMILVSLFMYKVLKHYCLVFFPYFIWNNEFQLELQAELALQNISILAEI